MTRRILLFEALAAAALLALLAVLRVNPLAVMKGLLARLGPERTEVSALTFTDVVPKLDLAVLRFSDGGFLDYPEDAAARKEAWVMYEWAGCADIMVDLAKADVRAAGGSLLVTLPRPRVTNTKMNHSIEPRYLESGGADRERQLYLRGYAPMLAEAELRKEAEAPETLALAQSQAEAVVRWLYEPLGYRGDAVRFVWR
jgi:hypothetical protein